MESKQDINDFEQALRTDLHQYLLSLDKVDERLPEAPDIEGLWPKIGESYLPDGMREFADYPTVSLGWMMFLGMAIAKYWDTDWELYSKVADLYHYLRDQRDYDHLDDHICEKVLLLTEEERQAMVNVVAECAHAPIISSATAVSSLARPKPSGAMWRRSTSSTSWAWRWN